MYIFYLFTYVLFVLKAIKYYYYYYTCQAILSSVILAQYEGKKFPGEVGDILEGPEYKFHLECPV